MKPSTVFVGAILFFGLWTGGSTVMQDLWDNHNVQSDTSVSLNKDYERMQKAVDGNNNSLRSKITTLTTDEGGVLDAASAGLLLVPQFIQILTVPFTALGSAVSTIGAAFSGILPGWAVTMVEIMIYAVIGFAIYSIALGVKS